MAKKNQLSDHEKIVFAHHYLEQNNQAEGTKLLSSINPSYFHSQFHKDVARALLCHATHKNTQDPKHGKESEFYLVVFKLTRHIVSHKIHFTGSGHFYQLKDELFKDFTL